MKKSDFADDHQLNLQVIREVSDDYLLASLKDKMEEQSDDIFDPAFHGSGLKIE